jgi:uncharacterized membrane protein
MAKNRTGRPLGRMLRWGMLAIGVTQVAAPAAVNRRIGIRPTPAANAGMRVAGAQVLLLDLAGAARARAARRRDALPGRQPVRVRSAVTVNKPPAQVYRRWRNLEELPRYLYHLTEVRVVDRNRSHWVARAPAGKRVEWDAEIVADEPERLLSWRALPGTKVPNSGRVWFAPAPAGAGTEVTVELAYQPPGGRAGARLAGLFGERPEQQVSDALRRFKQVLETGEVVRSDGTPEGALTARQLWQEPAQPEEGAR